MKKRIVSLFLALVLCLGLSVPAAADGFPFTVNAKDYVGESASGDGWSYDEPSNTLTLNGAKDIFFIIMGPNMQNKNPTLVLAPGSKTTIMQFSVDGPDNTVLTVKGSGELIVQSESFDGTFKVHNPVSLEDGLTLTGGWSSGDNYPLTLARHEYTSGSQTFGGNTYCVNAQPASYIRIGPDTGKTPADPSIAAPPTSSSQRTPTLPLTVAGFTDVFSDSPYAVAIPWAVQENITKGITATTFGPSNTCTVSHILTFLYRISGSPNKGDNERASVIAWAKTKDISVSNLDAPCTRAMAVEYMWKAAGSPPQRSKNVATFSDVPDNATYKTAVYWAKEMGITQGTSLNAFSPNDTCTRGQIVTFLYRTGGYMFRSAE